LPRSQGEAEIFTITSAPSATSSCTGAVAALGPEIGVVPDILADGEGDFSAEDFDGRDFFRRFEIAVLVEDVVSGQETFRDALNDFAAMQNGRGVAQRAAGARLVAIDIADDEGDVADRRGELRQGVETALDKVFAQEKVAGRIAAEGEFGGEHQFRGARDGFAIGLLDPGPVLIVRADGGVELEQAEAHEEI
jgi:hypothetical protein